VLGLRCFICFKLSLWGLSFLALHNTQYFSSFFTSKGLDKYNRFSDDFVVRSFDPEKCFFHPFFFFLLYFLFLRLFSSSL